MYKYLFFLLFFFFSVAGNAQSISATQKLPESIVPGKEFIIETTIKISSPLLFLKLAQKIPEGFLIIPIETKGGQFTFGDNTMKLTWPTKPPSSTFTVSYKIIVPMDASGEEIITGKIVYIVNEERITLDLNPKKYNIYNTKPVVKKDTLVSKTTPVAKNTKANTSSTKTQMSTSVPVAAPASLTTKKTYRVQIGAFTTKPRIEGIPEITKISVDNNVTKYFSGDFASYDDAVIRKREVIKKNFQGAFVVTFENGKITTK